MDKETFEIIKGLISLSIKDKDLSIDNLESTGETLHALTQIKLMLEGCPLNRVDGLFNEMNIVPTLIKCISESSIGIEFKNKDINKDNFILLIPEKQPKPYHADKNDQDADEYDDEDEDEDDCYNENGEFSLEKFTNFVKLEVYHTLTMFVNSKLLSSKIVEYNGVDLFIDLLHEPKIEIKNMMLFNLHRLINSKEGLKSIFSNIDKLSKHFELLLQHEDILKYGKGCVVVNIFNIVLDLCKVQNKLESFNTLLPRLYKYFDKYLMIDLEEEEIIFDICKVMFNMADNYPSLYKEFITTFNKQLVDKLIILLNHPIDTVVSWIIISLERVFNNSDPQLFKSYQLNDNDVLLIKMKSFINKRELRMPTFILLYSLIEGSIKQDDGILLNKLFENSNEDGLVSSYVQIIGGYNDISKLNPYDKQAYQIIIIKFIKIFELLNLKDLIKLLSMDLIQILTKYLNDTTIKSHIIESFEYLIELNNKDIISLFKHNDLHLTIIKSQPDNLIINKLN